jgi:hypothetical protein
MSMKKIGLLTGTLLVLFYCSVKVLFPSHPKSWYRLSEGVLRAEVLVALDIANLEFITHEFDRTGLLQKEVWVKKYWLGQWEVRCTYKKDLRLSSARVSYESYVFPSMKRLRYYSFPPPEPTLIDRIF